MEHVMKHFSYIQPNNLEEASSLTGKDWNTALLYAGGTDLLGMLKDSIENPQKLVNLKSISDLNNMVYQPEEGLKIGALVTIEEIANHSDIKLFYPIINQAANEVASPQLRNVGTIGGNICQRPRCWYYRGEFDCLRKDGDLCFAADGKNKYHCIIGGSPCCSSF
jgi:xanthine dehydrogenase YagS FAD-binding subunit